MNKSLMYPDRVLSLVVLMLSLFMILGSVSLKESHGKADQYSASIIRVADDQIRTIHMYRAAMTAVQETAEETAETEGE